VAPSAPKLAPLQEDHGPYPRPVVDGEVKLVFDRETLKNHRWSEEMLREHLSAILSSRSRFLEEKEEIRKMAESYVEFPCRKT
jgi:hypothetical protein